MGAGGLVLRGRVQGELLTVACHEDLSASDLTGRYLIRGSETVWMDGPLTTAARLEWWRAHEIPASHIHYYAAAGTFVDPKEDPSLAANPVMATGLIRIAEVAERITSGAANRGLAHATGGQILQHNLVCVMEGD